MNTLVTSAPCLKIFYSKLPTCLKTDASSVGLGDFLEQNYGTINNEISFPTCIQKLFLCLQKYNFELQYSPWKDMLVSDTFSRSHLSHSEPEFTEDSLIHHVHFVLSNLPISETRLKQFQLETKNDPILQTLITYTTYEWPEKHLIPTDLLPYYTHHSDITFCEGILFEK